MTPSPGRSIQLSLASGETGTPFSRKMVQLTKQAAVQLKWEAGYWRAQHDQLLVRSAECEHELKAQFDPEVLIILVCDHSRAYPCWARDYPKVLLAFCWAQVHRDFLECIVMMRMNAIGWVEIISS